MLTYAADFWPLFWTIIGAGAVLTVLMSVLVVTFSPAWFRRHEQAKVLHLPVWHRHEAGHLPKAA